MRVRRFVFWEDEMLEASDPRELTIYVVYFNPKDHPGRFVVRAWRYVSAAKRSALSGGGAFIPDRKALAVADTLPEARAVIPAMLNVGKQRNDDAAIWEVWV